MDKTKVRITDKEGFKERYIKRIEDLGDYYGEYPIPLIEPISRINSIIHGTRMPTQEELDIIAETMECSVDWLLNGGEYPELDWDNAPSMKRSLYMFRMLNNLTQKALAAELGIKPAQISKYENGTPVDQFVIDYIKEKYGEDIRPD